MSTVILLNILVVLFAFLTKYKQFHYGLEVSFFLIFLFLALRYNFGNDYMGYLDSFQEINQYRSLNISDFVRPKFEIGWVLLNRLFAPFGFFAMIAAIAAFTSFIIYRFIKKYVPPRYYWFAVFFYVLQPYNMLVTSSAMRQEIAVSIFLISIDFLIAKKYVYYLLLILLAALFHTTAYILVLFILINLRNWKVNKFLVVLIFLVFLIPLFYTSNVSDQLNFVIGKYFSIYQHYQASISVNSIGFGFFLSIFFFIITLFYIQKQQNERLLLFKLALVSYLILPLGFALSLISRMDLYLNPILISVFPFIFISIRKIEFKIGFISIVVLLTIYQFYIFFQSDIWKDAFGVYHSIFSAPQFY